MRLFIELLREWSYILVNAEIKMRKNPLEFFFFFFQITKWKKNCYGNKQNTDVLKTINIIPLSLRTYWNYTKLTKNEWKIPTQYSNYCFKLAAGMVYFMNYPNCNILLVKVENIILIWKSIQPWNQFVFIKLWLR